MPISDESIDFRQKYRNLKKKFKLLLYENECFQEELRKAQRKLLKVSRDKSFLLDRLLQYESVDSSSSDSDATESSDSDSEQKTDIPPVKKKKPNSTSISTESTVENVTSSLSISKPLEGALKKKKPPRKTISASKTATTTTSISSTSQTAQSLSTNSTTCVTTMTTTSASTPSTTTVPPTLILGDGHMTSEEIERHLEAKQALRDLLPEKAPLTVPVEMFSTEPSTMDSEMNDSSHGESPPVRALLADDDGLLIDLPD